MLYLASRSPRRRELLQQLGFAHAVLDVDVPEERASGETPETYVSRVALDKAQAGLAALAEPGDALVLGSDTEVVLDGEVFGKPADAEQAAAMLRRLSGRTHAVISAVWVVGCADARRSAAPLPSRACCPPPTRAGSGRASVAGRARALPCRVDSRSRT